VPPGGELGPVVSRPHLALVPANRVRARLRAPSARVLVVVAAMLAAVGLLYAAARITSLFALTEVEVTGGPAAVRESVRATAEPFLGESLVSLDQDELRRRLEALPTVRSLRVDRAFPHTLQISVVPERPLAVVRMGGAAWLVSERGRVIRSFAGAGTGRRATIWTASEPNLEPGASVQGESVRAALKALRQLPDRFPERVQSARAQDGSVTMVLVGGTELRLGEVGALPLKLAVATRVLRTMTASERAALAYLDVSVPERPVGGSTLDSQLEG